MYRASLSRTDNHTGWSVIFRHPALMDHRTGRHGRRVRYGLGTRDEAMARLLVSQLDELLADERWWTPSARAAAARFDPRVVDIFFGSLEKAQSDSREVRESLLPLPGRDSHTWVLFLGTTGAGKTTVVRQLIGTDPDDERFPTTATGRTTIADTEIISAAGSYDAAVTFFPLDEIREHLYDCILRAVVVAHRGDDRSEVRQAVLQHADQRFRFNYVLGDGRPPGAQESSRTAAELLGTDLFGPTSPAPLGMPELGVLDVAETASKIEAVVDRVLAIPHEEGKAIAEEIAAEGHEDPRVVEDLVEERLADLLRDDDEIHAMVDGLIDEMHARFDLVGDIGALSRNTQGWPESWRWSTHDRKLLLQALRRFTSNAKPGFGRLLTPLVNGVRVRGPFTPHWHDGTVPRLVLFDTEGLGHTQDSATSIPTRLTRLVDSVDAVVLVDNAEQPMQAAPAAAMRALARTGSAGKLHAVFTHFDAVTGDNLPTERDKALHVLNSCNGVLNAVGNELGPFAERPLRRQVQNASYFVGNAHRVLDPDVDVTAVTHLRRLLTDLERDIAAPTLADTRPVYDLTTLIVAIRDAVDDFQTHWKYVLGQATSMDVQKEHWKRIQALARRFAHREADEYLHLRPVAHLQAELQGEIFKLIQNPDAWSTAQPSEEDQQALYDDFANRLSRRLLDLSHRRVSDERHHEWQEAFLQSGKGSAAIRARIIADDVYAKAAPVPRAIPTPHAHQFLDEVMSIVRETAAELDIALR